MLFVFLSENITIQPLEWAKALLWSLILYEMLISPYLSYSALYFITGPSSFNALEIFVIYISHQSFALYLLYLYFVFLLILCYCVVI